MTTSWTLATHGQLAAAVRVHAIGTLLAGIAAATAVVSLVVAGRGRTFAWPVTDKLVAIAGLTLVGLLLAEWIIRLSSG